MTQETQEARVESDAFVGRWHGLVSTTNWEKGRIIYEWRHSVGETDAPLSDNSDEAWSQKVGGITPQHVGRLRRVYERFHSVYASYEGLYWSHFHAAIDWDDAEMWLEGAVQNRWSVSQLRKQRWETLGSIPELEPKEETAVLSEVNEDIEIPETGSGASSRASLPSRMSTKKPTMKIATESVPHQMRNRHRTGVKIWNRRPTAISPIRNRCGHLRPGRASRRCVGGI